MNYRDRIEIPDIVEIRTNVDTVAASQNIVTAVGFNTAVIVVPNEAIYTLDKLDNLVLISGNDFFQQSNSVAHIDGRFIYIPFNGDPAFFSDVGDAGSVQAASFFDAESLPDKNKVHIVDDSLVVTEDKITLPEEYNIIWVENDGEFVYFGTEHETGGQALVFPWRPGDETYSDPMPVYDKMSLAGANKSGVIHTINSKGQILKSNGQSFEEIARLPVANSHLQWQTESLTTTPLMVHANGFKFIEDDLHIMLSGMIGGITKRVLEEMPGGIWILNEHGIRQKYSVGNYDGSTDNDWGSSIVHLPGCIFDVGLGDGRFLVGAQVYKADVTTLQPALYLSQTSSTVTQRGYFITTQLTGRALRSFWGRLTIFFKEFDNSTDRIVVKFRTTKDKNFERSNFSNTFIVGTWDASLDTTITINDPNGANLSVGDELEVLSGIGGGSSTHILTVTNTSGNLYTIVLDEGVPNVEGTGSIIFRPQNWTKLGTISDTTLFQQLYTIVKRTKWIQLKVELRGTHLSPEVEQLLQEFKDSR